MNIRPHRTRRLAVPIATAAILGLTGCGSNVSNSASTTANAAGYPVTVDNCEREVTAETPPERVVSLHPSQTELLVRLGLADRLVGQAQTATTALPDDVAADVAEVPEISTTTPPAREDLLELQPDAVVSPTTYEFTAEQGFATIDQLEQAGAVTYVAAGGCPERRATATVDDLFTDLDALGSLFDVDAKADQLIEQSRDRLAAVEEKVAGRTEPTVAELYVEGGSISAIGAGVEYDIIRRAGGANVFSPDEKLFAQFFAAVISPEELAARNPDVIVFTVTDDAHEDRVREYLRSTFPDLAAVREDRLVAVHASDMFPGTLGNIGAVETIAGALYPEES